MLPDVLQTLKDIPAQAAGVAPAARSVVAEEPERLPGLKKNAGQSQRSRHPVPQLNQARRLSG
jgi:hypothetical protein